MSIWDKLEVSLTSHSLTVSVSVRNYKSNFIRKQEIIDDKDRQLQKYQAILATKKHTTETQQTAKDTTVAKRVNNNSGTVSAEHSTRISDHISHYERVVKQQGIGSSIQSHQKKYSSISSPERCQQAHLEGGKEDTRKKSSSSAQEHTAYFRDV